MDISIHHTDQTQALATCGPIVMRVIESAPTLIADIDRMNTFVYEVLERSAVAGMWIIVQHGAPIPDAQVFRHSGRVLNPHRDRLCVVFSMLGLGFWASAAHKATVGLTRLMGMPAPIEASVEDGARRLSTEIIGVDPDKLIAAYEHLLREMTGA